MKRHHVCWIFSIYNEETNDYFWKNLALLQQRQQSLIVVDGGSTDRTLQRLRKMGVTVLSLPGSTRGQRYDHGLRACASRDVVFVHPRTLLSDAVVDRGEQLPLPHAWGAFTHSFDSQHPILRFTSWWSNHIRGDRRGIFYLDHVLWSRRDSLVSVGGFPHDAIFEDTLFSQRLLSLSRPLRLPEITVTSSLRFKKNGVAKQVVLNQIAKLKFYLNYDNFRINQGYERGLDLNGSTLLQGQQDPAAEDPPTDLS